MNFPLNFKVRSKRFGNFAAYMLGGGKYTLDLASQKDVNNGGIPLALQVVKLAKTIGQLKQEPVLTFFYPILNLELN